MIRIFTPEQASRTLPLVRRVVADILVRGRELRRIAAEPADERADEQARARFRQLREEVEELMEELEGIGCHYKDLGFEQGLVDFPARIDGRMVFLCWKSDEPRVSWYHTIEDGYAGRVPIPDHMLAEESSPATG
ncbi:MAG: DUF2203 domain-containing protein [Planctomycetota bacterium]